MKRLLWSSIPNFRFYSSSVQNVLETGHILKQARIFSNFDIIQYSKLTNDSNPLHFDLERAKNAGFADLPVPGMLVASLFPRIIASHFVSNLLFFPGHTQNVICTLHLIVRSIIDEMLSFWYVDMIFY